MYPTPIAIVTIAMAATANDIFVPWGYDESPSPPTPPYLMVDRYPSIYLFASISADMLIDALRMNEHTIFFLNSCEIFFYCFFFLFHFFTGEAFVLIPDLDLLIPLVGSSSLGSVPSLSQCPSLQPAISCPLLSATA